MRVGRHPRVPVRESAPGPALVFAPSADDSVSRGVGSTPPPAVRSRGEQERTLYCGRSSSSHMSSRDARTVSLEGAPKTQLACTSERIASSVLRGSSAFVSQPDVHQRAGFIRSTRRGPRPTRRTATGPDQRWVADLTYVPAWAGFLELAGVVDVWSRRIVGWATSNSLEANGVLDALNMAITQPATQRRPSLRSRLQYTSIAFGPRCKKEPRPSIHGHRRRRV